jgi:ureidoacrylate peracid hydrolase
MQLSSNSALIIVDMQNGFCHEDGFMNKIGLDWTTSRDAVEPVDRLAKAARAAGMPVFYTRYSLNADYSDAGLLPEVYPQIVEVGGMIRGSWDGAIVDELAPQPGDRVIDKTRYSAFYDTTLEEQLRELGIDTVIVCGVTTNVCVESTVRDAFFRDFRIVVPSDATAAVSPDLHEGSLNDFRYAFGPVVTTAELEDAIRATAGTVAS